MGENRREIVLDSLIFYLQKRGGGSVYWYETISGVFKRNKFSYREIVYKKTFTNCFDSQREALGIRTIKSILSAKLACLIPSFSFQKNILYHSGYYRFNLLSVFTKSINLVTVYDFIPEKYLNGLTKFRAVYRKAISLYFCDGIICISENTKKDLLEYYPFCKNKQIKVIYCGAASEYFHKSKQYINLKKILFIGSRTSYKNFDLVLKIMTELPDYTLVVVGEPLNSAEEKFVIDHKIKIDLIQNVSNESLNDLYNEASCLLYPSSYEGFGIPVVEAMKSGCPVLGLNASSVAEISNGCALLADKLDVMIFKNYIIDLEDTNFRQKIVENGVKNAENFSWDTAAMETENFYTTLFDEY